MGSRILFEACVDSIESARGALVGGADRVELCADLPAGGVSPGPGTIEVVRGLVRIPVHVLVRPRAGDFLYSQDEFEAMRGDVEFSKRCGADGVVLGILREDGTVDEDRMQTLVSLARPMRVTFHRAFDAVVDPFEAIETLVSLGVDRILTSGQAETAEKGADRIRDLVAKAGFRIVVMAGGGLHENNVRTVVDRTGVREVHAAARAARQSRMGFRNAALRLGGSSVDSEYTFLATDADRVRAMRRALEGL
jgi:copper homeostasis protein